MCALVPTQSRSILSLRSPASSRASYFKDCLCLESSRQSVASGNVSLFLLPYYQTYTLARAGPLRDRPDSPHRSSCAIATITRNVTLKRRISSSTVIAVRVCVLGEYRPAVKHPRRFGVRGISIPLRVAVTPRVLAVLAQFYSSNLQAATVSTLRPLECSSGYQRYYPTSACLRTHQSHACSRLSDSFDPRAVRAGSRERSASVNSDFGDEFTRRSPFLSPVVSRCLETSPSPPRAAVIPAQRSTSASSHRYVAHVRACHLHHTSSRTVFALCCPTTIMDEPGGSASVIAYCPPPPPLPTRNSERPNYLHSKRNEV